MGSAVLQNISGRRRTSSLAMRSAIWTTGRTGRFHNRSRSPKRASSFPAMKRRQLALSVLIVRLFWNFLVIAMTPSAKRLGRCTGCKSCIFRLGSKQTDLYAVSTATWIKCWERTQELDGLCPVCDWEVWFTIEELASGSIVCSRCVTRLTEVDGELVDAADGRTDTTVQERLGELHAKHEELEQRNSNIEQLRWEHDEVERLKEEVELLKWEHEQLQGCANCKVLDSVQCYICGACHCMQSDFDYAKLVCGSCQADHLTPP